MGQPVGVARGCVLCTTRPTVLTEVHMGVPQGTMQTEEGGTGTTSVWLTHLPCGALR